MALIAREIINKYNYVFTEIRDPRSDDYFLMSSPLPIILIVASYLYFVTSLGPRLMRDRPPYKLDRLIQVYDVIQIGISLYLLGKAIKLLRGYSWFCEPVDYSTSPEALEILEGTYVYFLVKVIDFMDTILFVLRKKNTQITFLHVYHHAAMALGVWVGVKFVADLEDQFLQNRGVRNASTLYQSLESNQSLMERWTSIWKGDSSLCRKAYLVAIRIHLNGRMKAFARYTRDVAKTRLRVARLVAQKKAKRYSQQSGSKKALRTQLASLSA